MPRLAHFAIAALAVASASLASDQLPSVPRYSTTVARVAGMVDDERAQTRAQRYGLQVLNVLWEDTGRYLGSSVGPNISDVTIEVEDRSNGRPRLSLMPVIRFPDFSDKTADVRLDRIYLPVGNQRENAEQRVVSLKDFLEDPAQFMSQPERGRIRKGSLLAKRDTHALISAQAAFLPVPQTGQATFHPVIFNYQSSKRNPAVLTLLVTRQGTSMTIIDNVRDTVGGGSWGQRLFFNAHGQRAPFTAERLSDVQESGVTMNGESAESLGDDANLLMLVQVPLRYREPRPRAYESYGSLSFGGGMGEPSPAPSAAKAETSLQRGRAPDMEVAVLGHGPLKGPYTELDGLTVERDPRFPVRVTIQFYQATSNANVTSKNMAALAQQIRNVYKQGDYVGSLVVPAPKDLQRPTNWNGVSLRPSDDSLWNYPGLVERFNLGFDSPNGGLVGIK